MEHILYRGLEIWRAVAGKNTPIEQFLKQQYFAINKVISSKTTKKYSGNNFILFWSDSPQKNRIGIYMLGSCDLPSIFTAVPSMHQILNGTCCIFKEGLVSDSRSDLLLQSLQEWPQEWIAPILKNLKLRANQFQPRLFDKSFVVPGFNGPEEFPKKVIILSIAADVTRTVYQHREYGFLVDPGSWWFNQMAMSEVLKDLSTATWFKENFVSLGKIRVEVFFENFTRIIKLVKNKIGAHILVLNVTTVEPGSLTHNYQFVKNSPEMRRREFNLALVELSRQLDFPIVDIDRVLKKEGLSRKQMDFAHFPQEIYPLVAQDAFQVIRNLEIF